MSKPAIEAIYPLTFMQQALLFHHIHEQFDQGFLQVQCVLQGQLQPALLEQAFAKTAQRHAALRTSIHWENIKKPVQIVHPMAHVPWTHYDWRSLTAGEQAQKLEVLKKTAREKGFDLSVVPLSSLALARLRDDEYFFLWSCHHILLDGWSAAVVLKDTLSYYDSFCKGIEATLEVLPAYRTYMSWLQQQNNDDPRVFWKAALAGFEAPSLLGSHLSGDIAWEGTFRDEVFSLTAEATRLLHDYARRHRVTLTTVIQGLWAILLGRFLDARDIVFGATVSGRNVAIPNFEMVAGLFMNVLPVRVKLPGDASVPEWLNELQRQQMEARNFEYAGLDQVMSWINWPGRFPIFDNLLVVENFPWTDLRGGEVMVKDFAGGFTSTYPISVIVKPGMELEFLIRYQVSRIPERLVGYLSSGMKSLIKTISDGGDLRLSELWEGVDTAILRDTGRRTGNQNGQGGLHVAGEREYISPRNIVELKLTGIWEELFGRHPISVTEDFFQLGGSSILAVRLFAQIEKKLGRNLPPAALLQHHTIESLAQLLKDDDLQNWDSLVPIRAAGSHLPLFCVHAGGAHILFYHALARRLGADQPVYALQPTGLDGRAAYHNSVEEMASHYLKEIRKVQPSGPYALLGTCFGNAVCLEMARQIYAVGQSVSLLAIIDSGVYNQEFMATPTPKEQLHRIPIRYQRFTERFRKNAGKAILGIFLARMTRARIAMEKRFNFLRSRQTRSLYSVQKHLLQLHLKYDWRPFEGKVILIRSLESAENPNLDSHVSQWSGLAKNGVDVLVVPGHHETLFEEPEVEGLAGQLKKYLIGTAEARDFNLKPLRDHETSL